MKHSIGAFILFFKRASVISRKAVVAWVSLFFCVFSPQIHAVEYTVHVGPNGWAPFVMIDRSGVEVRYYGIMYDFLDAFESANPEFKRKTVLLTRKRVNAKMAEGEDIDIMLNSELFVSLDIHKHYKFTDTMFRTEDKVVTRKDQNFVYKTPHDLYGKSVGAIRGYSYGQFDFLIQFGFLNDVRVDSHSQGLGMLHKKRIDAYLGNIHVTPLYIKEMGLDMSDFVFSEISLYKYNLAFAVNRKRTDLYEKLNQFLKQYIAAGAMDNLINSYLK